MAEPSTRTGFAVEQHGIVADTLFEYVPDLRFDLFHQAFGALDGVNEAAFLELLYDKRFEELERHLLGDAALVQL